MFQLRFAVRSLLKSPVLTTVAVLSVALGIGANVAIFSIFSQVLLLPLPVPDPEQLVNLVSPGPRSGSISCGQPGDCDSTFSYPMFRDLERVQTVFTGIAAHRDFTANIAFGSASENVEAAFVSGSYFPVLRVTPFMGRLLGPEDDRLPGEGRVAVLSHEFWRQRFAARADVMGEPLLVNGQAFQIVGVAPETFRGTTIGERPVVFVPISMRELLVARWKGLENRRAYWAYLFARLKPGVTAEQALAVFNPQYRAIHTQIDVPLNGDMRASMLAEYRSMEMQLTPGGRGQSRMPDQARQPLTLLCGVTVLVLLICCANVANLLLARATARSSEIAVRLSIGAARRHVVGQLLTESTLLSIAGGVLGLLVAQWTLSAMTSVMPAGASDTLRLQLDPGMLLFAATLSVLTGVLFGLFPAVHTTRPSLVSALKSTAGQPSGARAASRFRSILAATQIALSMALLVSAGMFTKSLSNITRVDLGLNTDHVVVFGVSPGMNGYSVERTRRLLEAIQTSLSAFPGVVNVSTSRVRLISGDASMSAFHPEGLTEESGTNTSAFYNFVGPGYLRTVGIPLLHGREFTQADRDGAPKVAIVNQAFVKKFGLQSNPLGRRLYRAGRGTKYDIEIVGVAADSVYDEAKGTAVDPLVLMPSLQDPDVAGAHVYARTRASEQDLIAAIPQLVRDVDPSLPVTGLRTMTAQVHENIALDRFVTFISAAFAGIATLLAALGLYGVVSYTVALRTREFGLRMALGAQSSNVRRLVFRQVGGLTAAGLMIGLTVALLLGRSVESMLFDMNAHDPVVIVLSTSLVAGVALVAGLLPAYRASRVDPMHALRYE